MRDPKHKDHARGIGLVLARADPEVSEHDMNVIHRVLDPGQEELEELRAPRQLALHDSEQ